MKILTTLVLVIIILIFAVLFSFKQKQIPNLVINLGNQAIQICQKINQDDVRYLCLALVNKDEKYCHNLDSNPKNVCLAALKRDDSFCQKTPQNNRQYCYQNLVSASGKADFCDNLSNPEEISSCYVHFVSINYFISNIGAINKSMCDKVLKDRPEHDMCLAMTTQNANACNPASIDCMAYITKDISLCAKSASKTDEGECYHVLAMLNKNSRICEKIDSLEAKDDCYRDYSRLSTDETLCANIFNSNQKDQCLSNIAFNISKKE